MLIDRKYAVQYRVKRELLQKRRPWIWELYSASQFSDRKHAEILATNVARDLLDDTVETRVITITTSFGDPAQDLLDAMISRLANLASAYDEAAESSAYAAGGFDLAVHLAMQVLGFDLEGGGTYVAEKIAQMNERD